MSLESLASGLNDDADRLRIACTRASIRMRAALNAASLPAGLFASVVFFIVLASVASPGRVLGWLLAVNAVLLVIRRTARSILERVDQADVRELRAMETKLCSLVLVSVVVFASGLWLLGRPSDPHDPAFVVTVLLLMSIVAVMANHSTQPRTVVVGALAAALAVAAYWLPAGPLGWAVLASFAALAHLMVRFSQRSKASFDKTVRIRFENDELMQRLADANVAKARFLAAASHDLRQPVHALTVLASSLETASEADRVEIGRHIRRSAESLDKLFSGLLELSTVESKAGSAEPAPVDVHALCTALAPEFRAACHGKGLQFVLRSSPAAAWSDPLLLERIVRNLFDNALKYTSVGHIELEVTSDDDTVTIGVSDTGIGIARDDLDRIFDEFHQLHNDAHERARGAGLGLSIVRRACEVLGHHVEVQSMPGIGSRFSVRLSKQPSDATRPPSLDLTGVTACLIDGDADARTTLADRLGSAGARVLAFADSEAAAAALSAQAPRPVALLVDYSSGGEPTGYATIARLQQRFGAISSAILSSEGDSALPYSEQMPDVPVFRKPVLAAEVGPWLQEAAAQRSSEAMPSRATAISAFTRLFTPSTR